MVDAMLTSTDALTAADGNYCAPRAFVTIPIRQVRMGAGLVPPARTRSTERTIGVNRSIPGAVDTDAVEI